MTNTHKLRMKIGVHEFEAEGDKEAVEEQRQQFIELVKQSWAKNAAARGESLPFATPLGAETLGEIPSEELLHKVYKVDEDLVSLWTLPKSKSYAADTLILLLYGYHALKAERQVLSGHLMKAAQKSGLRLDRVDRVLDQYPGMTNKGGNRKGARYELSNPGIEKAKELMNLYR